VLTRRPGDRSATEHAGDFFDPRAFVQGFDARAGRTAVHLLRDPHLMFGL